MNGIQDVARAWKAGQRVGLSSFLRSISLALSVALATISSYGQVTTADLLGSVTDSSGAVVPGAMVKIENTGTHEIRSATSGSDGSYTFSSLQPGSYALTIALGGFKTYEVKEIQLAGGDRTRVDAPLTLGTASESIEVTANVSALQTDSTNVGTTITGRAVQDIPINGRNFMALVQISMGVNPGSANSLSAGGRLDDRRPSSSVSANGQTEYVNNQLIDGLDNNIRYNSAVALRPSVEALEQVRTDVNTYTAEVGRTAGAAINIITKSGTDKFHGSVFEFFRNDITDARNFFATATILPHAPELRQNQFGGSLGGPIVRSKTFFFVDYEGFRRIDGTNSVYQSSVPTAYEQQHPGDLSDIGGAVVPVAQINPTTLAYFHLYPLPNRSGTLSATGIPLNNFLYNPALQQTISLGDLRVDHHFNQSNTLFARYSQNNTNTYIPGYFPVSSTGAIAAGVNAAPAPGNNEQITRNAQLNYTHIFGPNLVGETKAGWTFSRVFAVTPNYGKNWNDTAPYLIPGANECLDCSGLATVAIVGSYGTLGDQSQAPADRYENTYQLAGSLTWTRGKHTYKFGGGDIQRNLAPVQQFFKSSVTFTGNTPQLALANFFHGTPFRFQRTVILTRPHERSYEPYGYVQDDWHISSRLTFNLGLRYEVFTPASEKDGKNSRFDLPTLRIVTGKTAGAQTDYSNINPRFGFAFSPQAGFVIRGGFGISHFADDLVQALILANPPNGYQTGQVTYNTSISAGVTVPTPQSSDTSALFGAITAKPALFRHTYVEQFNLLIQKEARGTVFTAGYVGEVGRKLQQFFSNIDVAVPSGPQAAGAPPPPAPYAAALPNVNTIVNAADGGSSSYHSLQTSIERRLYKGLSANVNYTFAHGLDDAQNQQDGEAAYGLVPTVVNTYDYGNSFTDVKHRFAGTFTYVLPFGTSGSHLHKLLAGGYQINGLGFWQTGTPITISSTYTQNGRAQINTSSSVTADRPSRGLGDIYAHRGTNFLNPGAFVRQPLGTAGNVGRNQFRGPRLRRGDLSVFKTVPIHESLSAQFRIECFNITNTPNFSQPNSVVSAYSATPDANGNYEATTASSFGQIVTTATGASARQLQFALRLVF